jgi:hypothetical protein
VPNTKSKTKDSRNRAIRGQCCQRGHPDGFAFYDPHFSPKNRGDVAAGWCLEHFHKCSSALSNLKSGVSIRLADGQRLTIASWRLTPLKPRPIISELTSSSFGLRNNATHSRVYRLVGRRQSNDGRLDRFYTDPPVSDSDIGLRSFEVHDPDGHHLTFGWALPVFGSA